MNRENDLLLPRILVIEDEDSLRHLLHKVLGKSGKYEVDTAENGEEALKKLTQQSYSVVLQDLKMPKLGNLELTKQIKTLYPDILIIIMTAYSTKSLPVEAMREGAFCYIEKPFNHDMLKELVARAFRQVELLKTMNKEEQNEYLSHLIIGNSPKMQEVFEQIRRMALSDSTVLITGESGTGKELMCQAIHHYSHRSHKSLVKTNCGAFQDALLESELFGHRKGAFTGAIADKQGLLQLANEGTFFLDEVAELSQNTQTKLLRVLENGEFIPIGSNETLRINVRFVAATNKNLKEEVCKGHFREDLFYRLNVLCLDLPPLRERKNDIPLLVGHFLKNYQKKYRELSPISLIQRVSETAMDILKAYSWPGNIRELENTLQRAFTQINEGETVLEPKHFDFLEDIQKGSTRKYNFPEFQKGFELEEHLAEYEKGIISRALERDQGNLTKTAKSLGISFRALRYKVKKYKL